MRNDVRAWLMVAHIYCASDFLGRTVRDGGGVRELQIKPGVQCAVAVR